MNKSVEKKKEYHRNYYLTKTKPNQSVDKRYRSGVKNIKTISLILAEDVYVSLKKAVDKTEDKNMSRFIEENVIIKNKETGKRLYKEKKTIKKTFTFSESFAVKLKKTGNMSLTVENCLKEILNK